jgi:hypothetical protein
MENEPHYRHLSSLSSGTQKNIGPPAGVFADVPRPADFEEFYQRMEEYIPLSIRCCFIIIVYFRNVLFFLRLLRHLLSTYYYSFFGWSSVHFIGAAWKHHGRILLYGSTALVKKRERTVEG